MLRRRGVKIEGAIGSMQRFLGVAAANVSNPGLVKECHEEYIKAGADVITTNTYACVPSVLHDPEKVLDHIHAGGRVAREVADAHGAMVAGVLPPLHESYRADRVGKEDELNRDYALIAKTIAPYSDVMLCETMSSAREAVAAMRAAIATGKPVWVAWALAEDQSGNLLSGESVEEAVRALDLKEGGPVVACIFNCSLPECISVALPRLKAALPPGVATGAYANFFKTVSAPGLGQDYRDDLGPQEYAALCAEWRRGGASVLGGCCGIFPEHIEAVARTLRGARL